MASVQQLEKLYQLQVCVRRHYCAETNMQLKLSTYFYLLF